MEKAFTIHLENYAPFLKNERIAFREVNKFLVVGNIEIKSGWIIFITCKTSDTIDILKRILSELKSQESNYKIVKDQLAQYALNAGAYGQSEVGKVISIFTRNDNEAVDLATNLSQLTTSYTGPVIQDALRIGNCIYAQYLQEASGSVTDTKTPTICLKNPLFNIPKRFRANKKRKTILGRYYIPIELISSSPKGDIFKAINLKKFAFNWCLIKQGKPAALDDQFNREMKDRLLWQKEVLEKIYEEVRTPAVLDYFESDGSSYLVMDYLEGENFGKIIFDNLNGTTWKELKNITKSQLLSWFLKAIDIVSEIHKRGFVHRDLTDSNFIVLDDGELCVIDFELSFDMEKKLPNPPFVLGSYGYAAPEQLLYAIPDPKEDVYSLGALMCYLLSGTQPVEFINSNYSVTTAKIHRLTGSAELSKLVTGCIHPQRKLRSNLKTLQNGIEKYLLTLK